MINQTYGCVIVIRFSFFFKRVNMFHSQRERERKRGENFFFDRIIEREIMFALNV